MTATQPTRKHPWQVRYRTSGKWESIRTDEVVAIARGNFGKHAQAKLDAGKFEIEAGLFRRMNVEIDAT